jgi:8-oxo-dGTP pyrophosphatase MutT (NUDIX family)
MNDTIYAALAIIYRKNNNRYEFLLLKHIKGFWTFPGGKQDDSDGTIEDALVRELKEEIGLTVDKSLFKDSSYINTFIYDDTRPNRAGKKGVTRFYLLEIMNNAELSSWDKIVEHGWFSREKTAKLITYPIEAEIFLKATERLI